MCIVKGYANIIITKHIMQSTLMRLMRKTGKDGPRKSLILISWEKTDYGVKNITTLIKNRKVIERKNGDVSIQNRLMRNMLDIIILIELKRLRENIDIH